MSNHVSDTPPASLEANTRSSVPSDLPRGDFVSAFAQASQRPLHFVM